MRIIRNKNMLCCPALPKETPARDGIAVTKVLLGFACFIFPTQAEYSARFGGHKHLHMNSCLCVDIYAGCRQAFLSEFLSESVIWSPRVCMSLRWSPASA